MPLGIVSDQDFELEVERCRHEDINRGRGNVVEVPEVIREVIAEEAILGNGSISDVADKFGVSASSVSAYKKGATSTKSYHEPKEALKRHNDQIRTNIISTARARLLSALTNITPDKLANAKVRDIASVAKDMSSVIHNMEEQTGNTNIGAQFVFHVPKSRTEADYGEVIDVTS